MPPERDMNDRDYGYRSTLGTRDLETRENRETRDLSDEIDVPVQRNVGSATTSRPQSRRASPPSPSQADPSPPHAGISIGRPQSRASPPFPSQADPSPPHAGISIGRPQSRASPPFQSQADPSPPHAGSSIGRPPLPRHGRSRHARYCSSVSRVLPSVCFHSSV